MEPMEDNSYNDDNFYKGLLDSIRQQSATAEGFNMTSDDFLSKYIEKVDRDQSDLRNDIRESERRISERTAAIEERMDNRLNRIEDMISSQGGKIDDTNGSIPDSV